METGPIQSGLVPGVRLGLDLRPCLVPEPQSARETKKGPDLTVGASLANLRQRLGYPIAYRTLLTVS
jgi:hypothetical protein